MKENLSECLGLPQEIDDFTDGKMRTIAPVPMKLFPKLIDSFTGVNFEKLWANYVFEEGRKNLETILSLSFKDEPIDDILEQINAGNFKKIMDLILAINGIDFNKSEGDEKNEKEV